MDKKSSKNFSKITKYKDLLLKLCKGKKFRKEILNSADKDLIESILLIVYNLLQGNINLDEKNKNNLKKYRHCLRKLISKSSLKSKKKILIQKGGFLEFLIPAAITGISEIISSLIK